jgi:hypothetical protein
MSATAAGEARRKRIKVEGAAEPVAPNVVLRTANATYELAAHAPAHLSFYWSYVVRSRGRWQEDARAREDLLKEAVSRFDQLGLSQKELEEIAAAGVVQVCMPFLETDSGWAPRILPWEFLLPAATRRFRNNKPLTVVRQLSGGQAQGPSAPPKCALFVENGAGRIGEIYSFDQERLWMESQLGVRSDHLRNPSAAQMQSLIAEKHPDVIHVSGVDVHQARWMGLIERSTPGEDGLLMAGPGGKLDHVRHDALAERLQPPSAHRAHLVALNFYNSAGRIGAAVMQRGAHAVIGFQDQIADEMAELFFATFYREWRNRSWSLLPAFECAFRALRDTQTQSLLGTGIVLWSDSALVGEGAQTKSPAEPPKAPKTAPAAKRKQAAQQRPSMREALGVRVQPPAAINYSLLHSGERLFETFTLYRKAAGPLPPVQVEVSLQAGTDTFPFKTSVQLKDDEHELRLADEIHLPLTSRALRAVRETVRSGLFVSVTCGGEEIECRTHRVTLCPVDEWRWSASDDSRWLGAFVLPRDPAVLAILDIAQKYLCALRDDSAAGFDGYQSSDPELEDPHVGVEMQVRAIWCALAFESQIAYVNPPPVFSEQSQRLRSPTEVMRNNRGTCIDLALMLAACLEYVEINPVVFVLKDHAFPGFWRSEEAYENFLRVKRDEDMVDAGGAAAMAQQFTTYEDVLRYVRSGDLIPIETVMLTRRLSFQEAIEEGMENLKDRDNFGALLDVRRERGKITPLPVLGGDA